MSKSSLTLEDNDCELCMCCHDQLLESEVVALRKTSSDDGKLLHFEMVDIGTAPRVSPEEVTRLTTLAADERLTLRQEIEAEAATLLARREEAEDQLATAEEIYQELKQKRKILELKAPPFEAEIDDLKERKLKQLEESTRLQAQIDNESASHLKKIPVSQARTDDKDVLEERKRLRMVRKEERCRQLHEALTSARQQELETRGFSTERDRRSEALQTELAQLKARRGAATARAASKVARASDAGSQAVSGGGGRGGGGGHRAADLQTLPTPTPAGGAEAVPTAAAMGASPSGEDATSAASSQGQPTSQGADPSVQKTPGVTTLAPEPPSAAIVALSPAPKASRAESRDEGDDLVYGKRRRLAGAGVVGAKGGVLGAGAGLGAASGAKFGTLFGGRAAAATPAARAAPPASAARRPGMLRSLFTERSL